MQTEISRFIAAIEEAGFTQELTLPFEEKVYKKTFYVYAKIDEGLIMVFDTFRGNLNGGCVYYNWEFDYFTRWTYLVSSGRIANYNSKDTPSVWTGYHNIHSVNVLEKLNGMRTHGKFLPKYTENPFMWLLHPIDSKVEGFDFDKINAERIAMLRPEVQAILASQ